jgi:hypothetical protein
MTTAPPTPKKPRKPEPKEVVAARQRVLKAAREAQGSTRVSGLYAKTDDHAVIKAFAKELDSPTGNDELRGIYAPKSQHAALKAELRRIMAESKESKK